MALENTWFDFAFRLLVSAPLLYCALYVAVAPEKVVQAFLDADLRLGGTPWSERPRHIGRARPSGFVRWIGIMFSLFWLMRVTGLERWAAR